MTDLVPRHLAPLGAQMLTTFPCVVVQGARQVGKSTISTVLAGRDATVLSLDDEATRAALEADPRSFLDRHTGTLVLDEAQRAPNILLATKASIDRDRRPGRFILTGSADLLRVRGVGDSLAGRAVDLRLRPFSQGERLSLDDDLINALVSRHIDPVSVRSEWSRVDYLTALERGGYPELQDMPERMRELWIEAYLGRLLSRDAASVPGGSNPGRLGALLRLLAANQSGELVKARLAQAAGVSEAMVATYLDALASVYLIDRIPPWTPNLSRRETGRQKVVLGDSALTMHLNGQSARSLRDPREDAIGPLLEGMVAGQILAQQGWSEQRFRLFHYRDRSGREVDLVAELADGRVIALEVKASSSYRAEQFRGLRYLRDVLGERFVAGIVLGTAGEGYQYAERLWGLPISTLWSHALGSEPHEPG
ncbi:ATP-binding protein [Actinomyces oricola]